MFVLIFKNCFLFLKTKNIKNLIGKGGVFLFFMFSVFLKITFLKIIKRCFHCLFTIQRINYFFCVFSSFFLYFFNCFLCFHKGEIHSTTTLSPMNPFFFLKLLKLIYLHILIKSSFV